LQTNSAAIQSSANRKTSLKERFFYSQKLAPYLFVLPFILSFLIFFAYPVVSTVIMSFQQVLPGETKFIGLDNYSKLWNSDFHKALWNSTRYTFWTILILIPVPLVLAVFLNSTVMRARNFFRSALFIPSLTSVVVAGTIFRLVFGSLDGALMNTFLHLFGHASINWLTKSTTGMLVLVVLAAWRWMGVNMLYYLSALQSIPHELYESAEIDGASKLQKFFSITLPLLKPVAIYVLTISIYGGYSMFTESYMLWNGNHSPNGIGLTIVGYIYQQGFESNNLGLGSAIGITLLVITMIVNVTQLNVFGLFKKED
jgi:arabinosaccharide transport system permease protein